MSACQSIKSVLPTVTHWGTTARSFSSDLWKVRAAIKGGRHRRDCARQLPNSPSRERSLSDQPVGCRYYYGKSYGNAQLICAMHPYGWCLLPRWVALEANL